MQPRINLIFAASLNNVIGRNGKLPWHLKADLARFKSLTTHSIVIMGRKTYESLPSSNRPLPDRINVVLTRHNDFIDHDVMRVKSIPEALSVARKLAKWQNISDIWFIGGTEVLKQGLRYADYIYKTSVLEDTIGDVFGPVILGTDWREVVREPVITEGRHDYQFLKYERIPHAKQQTKIKQNYD